MSCAGPAVPPSGASASAPPAALSTPAPAGKLVVYSALNEATNIAFERAFNKAHPAVQVEFYTLAASGDLQARIQAERAAPKADVFLGGSSEFHEPLAWEGLLESYLSPGAAPITSSFKDPQGRWTGWYLGIFGLMVNRERWSQERSGKSVPASWDDLLDPALEREVAMPDPSKTGGGYIFLASQLFRFKRDEAAALSYMKRLHTQVGQYTDISPKTIDLVGQGKFLLGLNWGHDILTAARAGSPVEFVVPPETACEVGAVSIVKGGPNPIAARAFVDWVLSREAAVINATQSNRLSVLKDVAPVAGAPTLEKVRLVEYDRAWATDIKDRLVRLWQMEVGR